MTDHLPQCWTQDMGGMKRASANSCAVCAALKSAIYDAIHEYDKQTYERCARHMRTARREALDAAREAVAATFIAWCKDYMNCTDYEHVCGERRNTLAAIDALRKDENE